MRMGAAFGIVVVAFLALTAYLFMLVPSAHPRRADAIVVLAGDRGRLAEGLHLFHDHVAPTLALSRDPEPWPKANRLCASSRFVCFHAHPYSTRGEAETVARLARAHGWHSIVVVTSRYHLRRARVLFGRCMHPAPAFVAAHTTVLDYVFNVPREWAKLLYQEAVDRGC